MNRYRKRGLFVEYYSATRRNEAPICATTWMSLDNVMHSKSHPLYDSMTGTSTEKGDE